MYVSVRQTKFLPPATENTPKPNTGIATNQRQRVLNHHDIQRCSIPHPQERHDLASHGGA